MNERFTLVCAALLAGCAAKQSAVGPASPDAEVDAPAVAAPPDVSEAPSAALAFAANYPGVDDIPPGEVRLRSVADGVWVFVATHDIGNGRYPSNGLIVQDEDKLLVYDTAWGTENTTFLVDLIASEIGLPIRASLSTHFHDDRVAGVGVFHDAGARTYATALTQQLARGAGNETPLRTFQGMDSPGDVLWQGPALVYYPGPGHAPDNLVIYVPHARVLYGGCAIHEASRTSAGNIADADMAEWSTSIQRIIDEYPDIDVVIPGHGLPGGPELLQHSIDVVQAHRAALED